MTVFDSNDVAPQGSAPEITGFSAQRPNLVGNPDSGRRAVNSQLNTSAFQRLDPTANAGQSGTGGRTENIGRGYADWDFAALQNFKVTEAKQFQFRAEFFDVLNRTHFQLPDAISVRRHSTIFLRRRIRARGSLGRSSCINRFE